MFESTSVSTCEGFSQPLHPLLARTFVTQALYASAAAFPASRAEAVFEWHLRKPFHILATFLATLFSQTPFVLSAVRQPASSPPNGVQTAWVTLAPSVIVMAASTMLANFVMWPPPLSR